MAKKNVETFTKEDLEEAEKNLMKDAIYGGNRKALKTIIKEYPNNDNVMEILLKVRLIDFLYSTQLVKHIKKLGGWEVFAEKIQGIKDLDNLIKEGNSEAVTKIVNISNDTKLYSFASKYCYCHNFYRDESDDYVIVDSVLTKNLPDYFRYKDPINKEEKVATNKIKTWLKKDKYEDYKNYVYKNFENRKEAAGIISSNDKDKFTTTMLDMYLWSKHR